MTILYLTCNLLIYNSTHIRLWGWGVGQQFVLAIRFDIFHSTNVEDKTRMYNSFIHSFNEAFNTLLSVVVVVVIVALALAIGLFELFLVPASAPRLV